MAKADITIRGREYSVACAPGQEGRLLALSRNLDKRVRRIADAVGDIGEARLLLVAALSLLDELDAAERGTPADLSAQKAAAALADAAARIEAMAERIEAGQ
ncbi:MAG: cell division protein ZapA [Pseudomonadota bacterium]|nr:cell division protein ZapA [Pseudomonadota bacterium]